jgi:hypothetical protein
MELGQQCRNLLDLDSALVLVVPPGIQRKGYQDGYNDQNNIPGCVGPCSSKPIQQTSHRKFFVNSQVSEIDVRFGSAVVCRQFIRPLSAKRGCQTREPDRMGRFQAVIAGEKCIEQPAPDY